MREEFNEVEEFWFLDNLYKDLAMHKAKPLSRMEKLHLRGLRHGLNPNQIALKLNKDVEGVQTDLSKTIYAYVKLLVGKATGEKIENWRCIPKWLEEKGYRKPLERKNLTIPVENLDVIVKLFRHINNIDNNTFTVEVNISFQTFLPNGQANLELSGGKQEKSL